ncbi:putative glycoside hydrolase [Microaerobacter geothermalis]|uniref:putative glycoside hydrolase n=1 Tax=Microaerobacter geothermalis TaxID=674972 RepID=UPI001F47AE36|nr:putative glycoside hydrolase [Microaerobacter geothermalis]MCF6093055.1 putative glycoside hydrolase [Microaerobacter geothermalis]
MVALFLFTGRDKGIHAAIIRPWYQSFTAAWVAGHIPYGRNQIEAQIKAGMEQGVEEYLLWNTKGIYPVEK